MFLRLVLVGMVAAMGVTLPTRWGCQNWFDSAGVWASATLAEWDTWRPKDAAGRSHTYLRGKTECPECRLARERARSRGAGYPDRGPIGGDSSNKRCDRDRRRARSRGAANRFGAYRPAEAGRHRADPGGGRVFVPGIASAPDAVPERLEVMPKPTAALCMRPHPHSSRATATGSEAEADGRRYPIAGPRRAHRRNR